MAGWFADPSELDKSEGIGTYSRYGYAGYQLPMYGSQEMSIGGGCADSVSIPNGADTANALANMEFNLSVATVGASNSMRQAAWEPDNMWGWSNEFMEQGTEVLYRQIFTVFGAVTVGLIGLYLLWRSKQADMNNAVTTVAWAVLILVLVTAVVRWPVKAAEYTDQALTIGMNLSTVLINDDSLEGCIREDGMDQDRYDELKEDNGEPNFCIDTRTAAVVASDTVSGSGALPELAADHARPKRRGHLPGARRQSRSRTPRATRSSPTRTPHTSTGLLSLRHKRFPGRRTPKRKTPAPRSRPHRGETGDTGGSWSPRSRPRTLRPTPTSAANAPGSAPAPASSPC